MKQADAYVVGQGAGTFMIKRVKRGVLLIILRKSLGTNSTQTQMSAIKH